MGKTSSGILTVVTSEFNFDEPLGFVFPYMCSNWLDCRRWLREVPNQPIYICFFNFTFDLSWEHVPKITCWNAEKQVFQGSHKVIIRQSGQNEARVFLFKISE
jgi:hypothetical protein